MQNIRRSFRHISRRRSRVVTLNTQIPVARADVIIATTFIVLGNITESVTLSKLRVWRLLLISHVSRYSLPAAGKNEILSGNQRMAQ